MENKAAATVDEYMQSLPEAQRSALEVIRQTIKATAPMAEECISYQIPTYKYKGALVHFAAFKNHCSLFAVNKDIISLFDDELKPFRTAGTTLHFTPENPIPASLIKKIVLLRIQRNEELDAVRQHRKTIKDKNNNL